VIKEKALGSEMMTRMPVNCISKQQFIGFFEFMSKNQFWTNKIKLSDIEDLFTIWSRVKPKKN